MSEDKTNVFQALIKRQPDFLDRPLKDLLPLRFMGEVAVNAYRGLIKRLDDLPLSMKEKESRLKDGQDAGKALLMIEARIGELLPSEEEAQSAAGKYGRSKQTGKLGVPEFKAPPMERHQRTTARVIASHPAEVAEVIREAEENEDIPTKTAVLNKIALKAEQARRKETEAGPIRIKGEEFIYLTKLQQIVAILPSAPPKHLSEHGYIAIKALALLIIKRLEEFKNETHGATNKNLSGTSTRLLKGKKTAGPDAGNRG